MADTDILTLTTPAGALRYIPGDLAENSDGHLSEKVNEAYPESNGPELQETAAMAKMEMQRMDTANLVIQVAPEKRPVLRRVPMFAFGGSLLTGIPIARSNSFRR
ncbi:MAG: hypothetical protein OEW15_12600 [Nitrospirota bacterium]|nr:hypothetical protein [Nitrospirota bacterium]